VAGFFFALSDEQNPSFAQLFQQLRRRLHTRMAATKNAWIAHLNGNISAKASHQAVRPTGHRPADRISHAAQRQLQAALGISQFRR
jgi:hypothetical protein